MTVNTQQLCPTCGSIMNQTGSDSHVAFYKCPSCGNKAQIEMTEEGNLEYAMKKRELLARLRVGFVDWRVTQWENLQKDLSDFIGRNEAAKNDIQLHMGIVACITCGFQVMDSEKYKKCKILFKLTEKVYKQQLKILKKQIDEGVSESVNDYKELRAKYKKCRNDYRNTKLMWKAVFFVFKKFAL